MTDEITKSLRKLKRGIKADDFQGELLEMVDEIVTAVKKMEYGLEAHHKAMGVGLGEECPCCVRVREL